MSPKYAAKMLQHVAIGFMIFALVWTCISYTATEGIGLWLVDLIDWPLDGATELSKETRWLSAIGAGLTFGIGVMLYGIISPAIGRGDREVRRWAVLGFVGWYLVDSIGSVAAGVPANAVFNAIFLLLALVPLLAVNFEPRTVATT